MATMNELAKNVALEAVNTILFDGKTIMQWIEEIKATRWISVKDRLPDVSGLYIVCCNDEGSYYGEGIWYASGVIVCADTYVDKNGRVTWNWCEGATEYDLDGIVTHWMPLPEPPKEE